MYTWGPQSPIKWYPADLTGADVERWPRPPPTFNTRNLMINQDAAHMATTPTTMGGSEVELRPLPTQPNAEAGNDLSTAAWIRLVMDNRLPRMPAAPMVAVPNVNTMNAGVAWVFPSRLAPPTATQGASHAVASAASPISSPVSSPSKLAVTAPPPPSDILRGTVLRCDLCTYTSDSSSHLAQHVRTHSGDRHYACDKCDCEWPSTPLLSVTSTCAFRHLSVHVSVNADVSPRLHLQIALCDDTR